MKGKKGKRVNFPSFLFQHSPLVCRAGVQSDTAALTQCQKILKQEIFKVNEAKCVMKQEAMPAGPHLQKP